MAALFGRVSEYEEGKEQWTQYVERLEHFFAANGITENEKKRSVFLSVIGPSSYKLLRNLVAPAKPGEKTFDELVAAMKQHHNPTPSEIVQRYKFHTRFRHPGESVATFVAELRALAEFCNFGTTLDDMLRDRLVCGISDEHTQRRLLAESKLTFKKALELAQGQDTAARNARTLQHKEAAAVPEALRGPVHRVSPPRKGGPASSCFRCGKATHTAAKCRFKEAKCHGCGKVGQLVKVCRSKASKQSARGGREQHSGSIKLVEDREFEYSLFQLTSIGRSKPLEVEVELDGQPVAMEVDTGASLSIISEASYRYVWAATDKVLEETPIQLRTYSGESLEVLGCLEVEVCYKEQKALLPLVVVAGDGPSLLGRDWLEQLRLDWKEIHRLHGDALQTVLARHPDVFQAELGTMRGYKATIDVDPEAKPRFCKACPVPYAMRQMVEDELDRLVREGITEPVQYAQWAAPIVPVLKSNKTSVQVCGDFRSSINQASTLDRYPISREEDFFATLAGGKSSSISLRLTSSYCWTTIQRNT